MTTTPWQHHPDTDTVSLAVPGLGTIGWQRPTTAALTAISDRVFGVDGLADTAAVGRDLLVELLAQPAAGTAVRAWLATLPDVNAISLTQHYLATTAEADLAHMVAAREVANRLYLNVRPFMPTIDDPQS